MPVNAQVAHRLPGRIRLRVGEKRGDPAYFSTLSEDVSRCDGVEHVKVNPATGSVVIEFSDSAENLEQQLRQVGVSIMLNETPSARNTPRTAGNGHVAPFHLVSNREITPMFMLGTMLAAVGIVQTLRGKILVPSLSVLWYAIEAFRQSGVARTGVTSTDGELTRH